MFYFDFEFCESKISCTFWLWKTLQVRSPYGHGYHYGDHVLFGDFAFTAAESGDYTACFSTHTTDTITVDFVWKTGVAAKDWNNVAKKGQIEVSLTMFLLIEFVGMIGTVGVVWSFYQFAILCSLSYLWLIMLNAVHFDDINS